HLLLLHPTTLLHLFLFYSPRTHRDLHSFPTRRSSDLRPIGAAVGDDGDGGSRRLRHDRVEGGPRAPEEVGHALALGKRKLADARSEEHTSELQSRGHLVCRLLLEKKKKNYKKKWGCQK